MAQPIASADHAVILSLLDQLDEFPERILHPRTSPLDAGKRQTLSRRIELLYSLLREISTEYQPKETPQ